MNEIVLNIEELSVSISDHSILKSVSMNVEKNKITAIMGPSGCGKTTLIRCVNRMDELVPNMKRTGKIKLNGEDIHKQPAIELRKKVGMVFQRPNPFPTMSIYENVIAGYLLNGIKMTTATKDQLVENQLKKVGLFDEVKDNLKRKGTFLSGGQQQRLCIARTLAMNPDVLLLDEPTSALDPKATSRNEDLIVELKNEVTILLVTHNMSQASRISDQTAFMYLGDLVEYGPTQKLFTNPDDHRTEEYLMGKFG